LETQSRNRDKIRFLISLMPGVHLRQVQRLTGMSFSSTRYHVEKLRETGDIVREEDGGYSRLFPPGATPHERMIFSLIRSDTNRRIIACLSQQSRLSNKQVADLTHLAKSTISQHLALLTNVGVVELARSEAGETVYKLKEPERIRSLLRNQKDTFLSKASGRFIDLWDF
jgi:predicted transcriptional regulator